MHRAAQFLLHTCKACAFLLLMAAGRLIAVGGRLSLRLASKLPSARSCAIAFFTAFEPQCKASPRCARHLVCGGMRLEGRSAVHGCGHKQRSNDSRHKHHSLRLHVLPGPSRVPCWSAVLYDFISHPALSTPSTARTPNMIQSLHARFYLAPGWQSHLGGNPVRPAGSFSNLLSSSKAEEPTSLCCADVDSQLLTPSVSHSTSPIHLNKLCKAAVVLRTSNYSVDPCFHLDPALSSILFVAFFPLSPAGGRRK